MSTRGSAVIVLATLAVACSRGTEGRRCFPNRTCYEGLRCLSDHCVSVPPDVADAARWKPRRSVDLGRGAEHPAPGGARKLVEKSGATLSPGVPWAPRTGHAAVSWRGAVWMLGGFLGGGAAEDASDEIWRSSDGSRWELVPVDGPRWSPRGVLGAAVHGDRLWIVGGGDLDLREMTDVWSSSDGARWTRIATTSVPARSPVELVSFKGRLWIAGGLEPYRGGDYRKITPRGDVWSSPDGSTWTRVTESAPWGARGSHVFVAYRDRLWIIGGLAEGRTILGDVWWSEDGVTWKETAASGPRFEPREGHRAVVLGDRLWILSGALDLHDEHDDAWYTTDGERWTRVSGATLGDAWRPRKYFAAASVGDRLIALAGWNRDLGRMNSIWIGPAEVR